MGTELGKRDERVIERYAIEELVTWAAGKGAKPDLTRRLREDIERVADEIAGASPTPAEKLLAVAAAQDAFALDVLRGLYWQRAGGEGFSIQQSEHAQRRIDRTHRRLMHTLRTLATLRRLAAPAVQVNVAVSQRVGGAGHGPDGMV